MQSSYDPKTFEERIYQKWMREGYFKADAGSGKEPFTIAMPPPNITSQLHIGHAMGDTIQDVVIRYKRMKGFEALYIPGTDHASIATEVKIVEKMKEEGLTKADLGREGFLRRAFAWKEQYGGRIVEQIKKLGISCDWDRLAFTMDERCSKAVRHAFVKLYNKKLIYRGDRIINWCPECKTAISDAEVEYKAEDGHLWHLRYPVEGGGFITVATTRPETMLGDTAVAVNPSDKRYTKYHGKFVLLPLADRRIPVVADHYVDKAFGTGAVKITPAHDPNDFEVGARHGLPVLRVMRDDGTMNGEAGAAYEGLTREAARKKVLSDLDALGLLEKTEPHAHNVGHCYRCHKTVEPIVSKQWFVAMKDLAVPAIDGVRAGAVRFIPKRFEKMYFNWMENIRDWCISRQLWWGHRIPVFYCDACGFETASETDLAVCPKCGRAARQDEDVLDTWFSSALWPFSTLGWPEETPALGYFYPTNVLVTAYDIITFWVSRMIFSGYEYLNKKPFSDVLIHGLVRDAQGRKMSKSLGNGIDPMEIIEAYGADSLRFSLVSGTAMGGDVRHSREKLEGCRNFMNKIWNAARFVLLNAAQIPFAPFRQGAPGLTLADRWILSELNAVTKVVTGYMDKYEAGLAASAIYDFVWSKFCDWYIETAKAEMNGGEAARRERTVGVLLHVLRESLKLLHPFAPFITAEIYNSLPNKDATDIMVSAFPLFDRKSAHPAAVKGMGEIMEIVRAVRHMRQEMRVPQAKRTMLYIAAEPGKEKLLAEGALYIEKLCQGSGLVFGIPTGKTVQAVTETGKVYIPLGELVDEAAEIKRLLGELETVSAEIKRAEGKLSNPGFTAKAPPALIEEERQKVEKYRQLKEKLTLSLRDGVDK
ncbi:MAG: valine--tRNA ligase [Clostridiales bacterium]|jgi:valyl-tRNA synthetase|nr:valine--tRNA ligase [Clostridiales bacterium]